MFCFFLYLPIGLPHQNFFEFYPRVASNVTHYLVYDLHPLSIVMPISLLLYGLLLYNHFTGPPAQNPQQATFQPIYGRHYTVDCRVGLPATYMVFFGIMLLPNYIQLLKNRHRVYDMNTLMRYSICDILMHALLFCCHSFIALA
jgi:hypothetical protein